MTTERTTHRAGVVLAYGAGRSRVANAGWAQLCGDARHPSVVRVSGSRPESRLGENDQSICVKRPVLDDSNHDAGTKLSRHRPLEE